MKKLTIAALIALALVTALPGCHRVTHTAEAAAAASVESLGIAVADISESFSDSWTGKQQKMEIYGTDETEPLYTVTDREVIKAFSKEMDGGGWELAFGIPDSATATHRYVLHETKAFGRYRDLANNTSVRLTVYDESYLLMEVADDRGDWTWMRMSFRITDTDREYLANPDRFAEV